jgi:hypothetical protein
MSKLTFEIVDIEKPDNINFILGQSHFIKTVEDIHEALVNLSSEIKFGLAFCEASGPRLIRWTGTDDRLIKLAQKNMKNIATGHSFILFLGEGFYPLNILNSVRMVPEIVNIYCATANPAQIIIGKTAKGRSVLGVVDGGKPMGVENDKQISERKNFLRDIGYKL